MEHERSGRGPLGEIHDAPTPGSNLAATPKAEVIQDWRWNRIRPPPPIGKVQASAPKPYHYGHFWPLESAA